MSLLERRRESRQVIRLAQIAAEFLSAEQLASLLEEWEAECASRDGAPIDATGAQMNRVRGATERGAPER